MKVYKNKTEAWVTHREVIGKSVRKALETLRAEDIITLKEFTDHTRKTKKNHIYLDLNKKVTGCFEYHNYKIDGDEGHHVVLAYNSDGVKKEVYLKVRNTMWITKGEIMNVTELLKMKRGITVHETKDGRESKFQGWIVLKPEGKKEFAKALDLEWWFTGRDTATVKCKNKKEADCLMRLFDSIEGDCYQDEWDAWFREPTQKEWDAYERRMVKKYGKSWEIITQA